MTHPFAMQMIFDLFSPLVKKVQLTLTGNPLRTFQWA